MSSASPLQMLQRSACALLLLASLALGNAMAQGAAPAPSPPADAPGRAQRLDRLFADLKTTTVEEDGDKLVAEIWKLWMQSGDADLDRSMEEAVKMIAYGLHPQAMTFLDDLVVRAPNWAEAWNKRATLLYLVGELDRSLADCDRVLALEPRHFGALAGIGLIRIAKDEPRQALAALRRALAVNPFLKERFSLIPALEKQVGEKPI
jgi:tetratricopeptide (TPR) repeat protein